MTSALLKPSPLKTELPRQVYDEPLYPKLYSLSCPAPVPLRIEEAQRKGGTESKQDPAGPSWYKSPSVFPVSSL